MMALNNQADKWEMIGITSNDKCTSGQASIFVKVDSYKDFIDSVTLERKCF